jgi:hypothetical protein
VQTLQLQALLAIFLVIMVKTAVQNQTQYLHNQQMFHFYKYRVHCFASVYQLSDLNHCQSSFRGASIPLAQPGPHIMVRHLANYAVCPKLTKLYQRAALTGARNRSVSSWHGMPTASVKNKHFQN